MPIIDSLLCYSEVKDKPVGNQKPISAASDVSQTSLQRHFVISLIKIM